MYHPQLGRFVSRDPAKPRGDVNSYQYVDGSPIKRLDAFGLAWYDVIPGVGTVSCWMSDHSGDSIGDYPVSLAPSDQECRCSKGERDEAEAKCREAIRDLANSYIVDAAASFAYHLVGDAVVGGIGAALLHIPPAAPYGAALVFASAADSIAMGWCVVDVAAEIREKASYMARNLCIC